MDLVMKSNQDLMNRNCLLMNDGYQSTVQFVVDFVRPDRDN